MNTPKPSHIKETEATYQADKVYTYQDYLSLPEEECFSYEVLDGMLVREPAPTVHHQRVSRRLQHILENYFLSRDPEGEVFNAPIDMTLSEINVMQPDLMYVPAANCGIVEEKRINGAPLLVVEVLSPATRSKDRIRKLRIYERLGVPHYWIVDPENRTIEAYALVSGSYVPRGFTNNEAAFTHPDFPALVVDMVALCRKPRLC